MAFEGWPVEAVEFFEGLEADKWRAWEIGAWLGTPEPVQRVRDVLRTAEPLVAWLDTRVGPSELEDSWR